MPSYRLVNSGKKQRREYLSLNRSPLFQALPERDFAQEQKASYSDFIDEKLPKLLTFYFPFEFSDYNNDVWMNASEVEYQESSSEEKARIDSSTWNYLASFNWKVSWDCHKIQIQLLDNDFKKSINQWIEESFKISKFTCKKKSFSPAESKSLLTRTRKQLQELQQNNGQVKSYETAVWRLTNKIKVLEQNQYQEWEIKENKGKKNEKNKELKIVLEILEQQEDNILISFHCQQDQRVDFCHLPKMTQQGNFIINGHDKVVVFQSVRAPSIYFFNDEKNKLYGEIIPFKGPWISVYRSVKDSQSIELKFLNSKLVISLLDIFKTFDVPSELLEKIFDNEELNIENYSEIKPLEVGVSLPRFLFVEKNSYFDLGKLGRKKYNQKTDIFQQVEGQTLASDLYDSSQKLILKKNSVLTGKNLQILQTALKKKKLSTIVIPHSTNSLCLIKIKSPQNPKKILFVIGIAEDLSEEKTYFDLADLICTVSNYINLQHGLGRTEMEEEKDDLKNQIVRRVGDLIYNIFENKLGGFLQNLGSKYVTNYLSQLKKVDLLKIPDLKEFDNLLRNFFNTSALVQLQNQNNPLSEISYARKLSVLGLGGFSASNTTLTARNINPSYYGRYDLVETPEGQRIGLIHNLTIGAEINAYGQIVLPCYFVQNGIVTSRLDYLTSEEEWDKYVAHCNIEIDEKNKILEEEVSVRHQGDFKRVPKEKVNYIDSSFYHLNSVTSAIIPFFQHNDATRMLMSSNMQRQAVTLLKNEAPLVASGLEATLLNNSSLVVRAEEKGEVKYADNQQIVIKESSKKEETYRLRQLIVSNKNILNFSFPLVKKGEKVEKGQMIACGSYADQGELALGYNLRVAYLCWNGYNYEDAIVVSERLVKEDILTSLLVKKHKIIRYNTKYGPEIFTPSPHSSIPLSHLDKNGLVKIGTKVKSGDILVGKQTPEPPLNKETEEEMLLLNILGKKAQRFINSSLFLPAGEEGTVYAVETKQLTGSKNELELVEVYVFCERKLEAGDKLTTRFGNKGVVAKIVPESDMPFDEEGRTIDIIFNPLGVPTRLNLGQLLETILGWAARKLNTQFLFRTFNTPSLEVIKEVIQEAGIKNYGSCKLFDGQTGLPFQLPVYNGYIYVVKVNHMVVDKFHARSTGPRSLIYQQPLKGRAQKGGQRIGEMEGWVLMAMGAAWNLMEMMGPKSDDIYKQRLMQKNLIFGDRQTDLQSSQSESFNLLLQYLRGIGFDLQAFDYQGREIDFYESFSYNIRKKK